MKRLELTVRSLQEQILGGRPKESQLRTFFDCVKDRIGTIDATYHPLGFIHVNLGNFDGQGLRLHIWASDVITPVNPLWPIHNHTFDIASYVSTGTISNITYQVEDADVSSASNRFYSVEYINNISRLRATERLVRINHASESTARRGEIYRVNRGTFHASTSKTVFSCTVVCTFNNLEPRPLVLGDVQGAPLYENARRECERTVIEPLILKAANEYADHT